MRKLFTFLFAAIFIGSAASAQTISGIVKDQQGNGVDKTTVSLLKIKDSSVVKLSVTDNDGKFALQAEAGQYLVSASHVAYLPLYSKPVDVQASSSVSIGELNMIKKEGSLKGVTVTSEKPMVEVKADKMIVNVEGTINAVGNDALELLRRSPGVTVDKDDNLSLAGKNGVQVYIDGKPSPLSGADLAAYLKSLQSVQIEAIELITNPSAKYEAAGNAGIINIRLKKNKAFGTNGSVNAGYNIGIHSSYIGGMALNHRNSKINVFGNYNYNDRTGSMRLIAYREQADSIFDQVQRMKMMNKGHNFKTGIDYFVGKNSTLGAMINGNISENDFRTQGPMNIYYKPTGQLVKMLNANNNNEGTRKNVNFNLNYRLLASKGRELNIDADYGIFNLRGNQFQPNYYFDKNGAPLYENVYRMISPTNIDIYSLKIDYEQDFQKGKLGYGGKLGNVNTDNNFNRYNVIGGYEDLDKDRSNRFEYKENINAGYVNYNRAFKGLMVQFGLRIENTISEGLSTGLVYDGTSGQYKGYDSTIKRNYTDVFPSGAITFNKNPMSQFGFTFSRRIDRPAYQDLNPFEFKLNDYTFMKGNTRLRPQYTNSVGFTHTYKYKLNTVLNYSHVKDIFTMIPDTTEKSKSFITKENLATADIVSLNISYPFQYKAYSFFANLNTAYSHYQADFGGGDRVVNQDVITWNFFMQNSIKFAKTWTAELSGFYNSPGLWQGFFKSKEMYSIDAGLQKAIFKGKGNIKASVSDVFKTMGWGGSSNFTGTYGRASGRWESRQMRVNFTYRFGSTTVKASRQRKTGLEDENKRASGGGQGTTPAGQ